jgi:hypothetical protein
VSKLARAALVAACASLLTLAPAANTAVPAELPKLSNDDAPAQPLQAGTTFEASLFPLRVHSTAPDASWLGGQWKLITAKRGSFGYLEFLRRPANAPLGALSLISSFDPTPSLAATVKQLRTGPGATFEAATPITLAGFSGSQFDGRVTAKHHVFVPFTTVTRAATYHPDAYRFDQGEAFRIVVLEVRGKTVVLLLESAALPASQFPNFLETAGRLLATLRFPS